MILLDILAPGLDIVFCGTAVGPKSAQRQAYYAGPGNKFWWTLHRVRLTPTLVAPEDFQSIVQWKLGLTDMAKNIAALDNSLSKSHFSPSSLKAKISKYRPKIVAFTSKRAAEEFFGRSVQYGLQSATYEGTQFFVLPSPSGAARRYWNEAPWHALATLRNGCDA
jgi:TDG/mug DNA glycosylase family protein